MAEGLEPAGEMWASNLGKMEACAERLMIGRISVLGREESGRMTGCSLSTGCWNRPCEEKGQQPGMPQVGFGY